MWWENGHQCRVCICHTAPVICVLVVHLVTVGLADPLSILFPQTTTLTLSTDPHTQPHFQRGTREAPTLLRSEQWSWDYLFSLTILPNTCERPGDLKRLKHLGLMSVKMEKNLFIELHKASGRSLSCHLLCMKLLIPVIFMSSLLRQLLFGEQSRRASVFLCYNEAWWCHQNFRENKKSPKTFLELENQNIFSVRHYFVLARMFWLGRATEIL